jgi:hypothetical protein
MYINTNLNFSSIILYNSFIKESYDADFIKVLRVYILYIQFKHHEFSEFTGKHGQFSRER